jgi:maltooligosyltrehalose trehalohydrolase
MFDASPVNVMHEITQRVRAAGGRRSTLVIAENEPQDVGLLRPAAQGGFGMDALWNDDFHHSSTVALTGHNEAYYSDYAGTPQELVSAVKHGFLYQGQRFRWQKKRRGTPAFDIPARAFVTYIQNHDQVANSACGTRMHLLANPGRYRALTALMLLAPGTPMLFQGQEFAASSPFLFFADHHRELAAAVRKGRAEFMSQFPSIAQSGARDHLPDPGDRATFERCILDWSERERHGDALALHRDLLSLRREDAVFRSQGAHGIDGAVLGAHAFVLRFFGEAGDDRVVIVNLGSDLHLASAPEPLLAPPRGHEWRTLWSSEDVRYCGCGTSAVDTDEGWRIPGEATVVLAPRAMS